MIEGERILGRFLAGRRLGSGGFGVVHEAWDERLCRKVAIKEIEGAACDRVLREAQAAARLNHPSIVTLYELGEAGGRVYLVSELVSGANLRELAADARLTDRDVAELGAQLCAALAHAHKAGVVHRDIKPDNILIRLDRDGHPQQALLADFGIASIQELPGPTADGQVIGTLAYMAPEQAAGEQVGPAADVYSLALSLFELWSGANPARGSNPAETARLIGSELPELDELRPELPAELAAALAAALDPDPARRPSPPEFRTALERVGGDLHPERPVPEPEHGAEQISLPAALPRRPFAVLVAAGLISLAGIALDLPGIALVIAVLFGTAALAIEDPRDWLRPVLAPALGLLGVAPAYLVWVATRAEPRARVGLAATGALWTALVGAVLNRPLGVGTGGTDGAWTGSGPAAVDSLIGPLLGPETLGAALIWVGAAVLLGALLDHAGAAALAIGGLLWSAGLVTMLGAIEGVDPGSVLLIPALVTAIGYLIWDRAGRPGPGDPEQPLRGRLGRAWGPAGEGHPAPVARPRLAAAEPLADQQLQASRMASRHVEAALHGSTPQRRSA